MCVGGVCEGMKVCVWGGVCEGMKVCVCGEECVRV